ncbi:MAG: signal peptidase II [Gemmatimonadota bacterium]|nr:signal peptidase II [Gemmatimonadota bacterium]
MRRPSSVFWGTAAAILAADQATKWWAVRTLEGAPPTTLVGDWARLVLVYNPGAAFGLHVGTWSREIFATLTVAALVVLWRLYRTATPAERGRVWTTAFVAGGALGNLVDRVRRPHGVVDFLDLGVGDLRWPTFNVADVAVCVGAVGLAWVLRDDAGAGSPAAAPRPEAR